MEAILALEDGTVFRGHALGAAGEVVGEVVFNTGMTGYQEILTDPSYRGQIVVLTVSHVGNTGVNDEDPESERPQAAGLIVRDAPEGPSSWRARADLPTYMRTSGVSGLSGIDTRALVRRLRERGVMRGCLTAAGRSTEEAVALAKAAPPIEQADLVGEVTCERAYAFKQGRSGLLGGAAPRAAKRRPIVAFDFGVKRNILRLLVDEGFDPTVVPARTSAADVLAMRPAGVFLSNGPGDPAHYGDIVETVAALIGRAPVVGICLGHQLAALALGARTYKLKFGHRGTNHPVRDERTGAVAVTSQNHGYAVDEASLPTGLVVTHRSLNDDTVEGLAHEELPLLTVQYHPEGAPGPHDSWNVFRRFAAVIDGGRPLARG